MHRKIGMNSNEETFHMQERHTLASLKLSLPKVLLRVIPGPFRKVSGTVREQNATIFLIFLKTEGNQVRNPHHYLIHSLWTKRLRLIWWIH